MLGNRVPEIEVDPLEIEVDTRHGTQQVVSVRRRLQRVSKYGCPASSIGHWRGVLGL